VDKEMEQKIHLDDLKIQIGLMSGELEMLEDKLAEEEDNLKQISN
jgi:hypothetical protein